MTLAEFAPTFLAFTARRCKKATLYEYQLLLRKHILPRLGSRGLHQVTSADVEGLHAELHAVPIQANRAVAVVMRLLRVARLHDHTTRGVERPQLNRERPRTKFLTREEASTLLVSLNREPSLAAVAIKLLLLTGLRKTEALSLRWEEVDLHRRLLLLSDTKTGPSVRPLSKTAAAELAALPRISPWVFPGRGAGGFVVSVDRTWRRVRRQLGHPDLRLHDLRHSYASLLVAVGVPIFSVSRALGHKSTRCTERYAHLAPEALVAAVDKAEL